MNTEVDVERMIPAIQRRPALWDISCEQYRDKIQKKIAWTELCEDLFDDFYKRSREEQIIIEKYVSSKWRTVRDGYVKSKKKEQLAEITGSGKKPFHKYLYFNQLEFLNKSLELRKSGSFLTKTETVSPDSIKSEPDIPVLPTLSVRPQRGRKRKIISEIPVVAEKKTQKSIIETSPKTEIQNVQEFKPTIEAQQPVESVNRFVESQRVITIEPQKSLEPQRTVALEAQRSFAVVEQPRINDSQRSIDTKSTMEIQRLVDSKHNLELPRVPAESPSFTTFENDDDMDFFRSLLPMVRKLGTGEKLKFRMDVMNSLQMAMHLPNCDRPVSYFSPLISCPNTETQPTERVELTQTYN